jgi:hypothetical protein
MITKNNNSYLIYQINPEEGSSATRSLWDLTDLTEGNLSNSTCQNKKRPYF